MLLKIFLHLVFLSVFLFWNTFSCTAFTNESVEHEHNAENIHTEVPDDCCPKDGHKKQIESKNLTQTLQKQGFDVDPFIPQNEKVFYDDTIESRYIASCYHNPLYDKQSLFFTDTVRLLL